MYKIRYKIDIVFIVLSFIVAMFMNNKINVDATVLLAVMLFLHREMKLHIDSKFDKWKYTIRNRYTPYS